MPESYTADLSEQFKQKSDELVASGEAPAAQLGRNSSSVSKREDELFKMEDFHKEVQQVKTLIERVRILTAESSREHELAMESTRDRERHDARCEDCIRLTRQTGEKIRKRLRDMDTVNKVLGQDSQLACLGHTRMRLLQHHYLVCKFKEAMDAFGEAQARCQNKRIEQIDRQYRIIKPEAPQEELEQLHQAEIGSEQLFQLALTKDDLAAELLLLQKRRDSMLRIEKRVEELQTLFSDFYTVSMEEGEHLNDVAAYLTGVIEYMEVANAHMVESVAYMRNIRKLRCSIV